MRPRGCAWLAIAYPVVEIAVAVGVASVFGWYAVFVAVVIGLLVGAIIVRLGARAVGRSWNAAMRTLLAQEDDSPALAMTPMAAATPATPPAQALLIIPAGLLIAIPGFVSDVAGLILLVPAVRRRIAARWEGRMRG